MDRAPNATEVLRKFRVRMQKTTLQPFLRRFHPRKNLGRTLVERPSRSWTVGACPGEDLGRAPYGGGYVAVAKVCRLSGGITRLHSTFHLFRRGPEVSPGKTLQILTCTRFLGTFSRSPRRGCGCTTSIRSWTSAQPMDCGEELVWMSLFFPVRCVGNSWTQQNYLSLPCLIPALGVLSP